METNQTMLFLDATAFILNRDCVEHLRESSIDITAESGFSCPTNVVEQLGVSANTGFLMMRKSEALEQFVASMRVRTRICIVPPLCPAAEVASARPLACEGAERQPARGT